MLMPSHNVGLSSHSAPCRPIAFLSAGLPSHSVGLPSHWVGLPSLSVGLPSHSAAMLPCYRLFRVPRHTTQQGDDNTLEGGGPSHDNGRPSLDGGRPALIGVNRRQAKVCRSPPSIIKKNRGRLPACSVTCRGGGAYSPHLMVGGVA